MNEVRLKPSTPSPKKVEPIHPPTTAPMIPRTIDPKIPPYDGRGSMKLAILPAIKPKTIQYKIPMLSPPFCDLFTCLSVDFSRKEGSNWG